MGTQKKLFNNKTISINQIHAFKENVFSWFWKEKERKGKRIGEQINESVEMEKNIIILIICIMLDISNLRYVLGMETDFIYKNQPTWRFHGHLQKMISRQLNFACILLRTSSTS